MALKPLFGTLNATVSKTLIQNAPKYRRIVEPFGDSGTWALELKKRRPKEHLLNIVDPDLFAAMTFAQGAGSADKARLKAFDWIASQETFDKVLAITATEGPEHFYKFLYTKKFGMRMDPEQPPVFDILSAGKDLRPSLFALPIMKVGLKGVQITNDEPSSAMGSANGADTFLILLPKSEEDTQAALDAVTRTSASVFCAVKVADTDQVMVIAERFRQQKVAAIKAPSIMMATMATVSNYDNKLEPLDTEKASGNMKMPAKGKAAMHWHRVYRDPRALALRGGSAATAVATGGISQEPATSGLGTAHYHLLIHDAASRVIRKEITALGKAAKRCASDPAGWAQVVDEFYTDHASYVAGALRICRDAAERYVDEQRAALLTVGAAVMEDWETVRVVDLVNLAMEEYDGGPTSRRIAAALQFDT